MEGALGLKMDILFKDFRIIGVDCDSTFAVMIINLCLVCDIPICQDGRLLNDLTAFSLVTLLTGWQIVDDSLIRKKMSHSSRRKSNEFIRGTISSGCANQQSCSHNFQFCTMWKIKFKPFEDNICKYASDSSIVIHISH